MNTFSDGSSTLPASTTSPRTSYRSRRLFYKSHLSLILSRLLSKPDPLSLGSGLVLGQRRKLKHLLGNKTHVVADVISFAATFLQKSPLTHFAAAPLQTGPTALGSGLVLGVNLASAPSILFQPFNKKDRLPKGSLSFLSHSRKKVSCLDERIRIKSFNLILTKGKGRSIL